MPKSKTNGNKRTAQVKRDGVPRARSGQSIEADLAGGLEGLSHLPDALLSGDFSQRRFEQHAALLGGSRMSTPMYDRQRAAIVIRLQRDYGNRYVQRLVKHISRTQTEAAEGESAVGPKGGDVEPEVSESIDRAKGGGTALPGNLRDSMEGAFGADFSGVRVHSDAASDSLNSSISARAFTTGQDIFFGKGEYDPGGKSGQEVLAHELTHVVQQEQSNVIQKSGILQRVGSARKRQIWITRLQQTVPGRAPGDIARLVDVAIPNHWNFARLLALVTILPIPVDAILSIMGLHKVRSEADLVNLGNAAAGGLPSNRLTNLTTAVPQLPVADVITLVGLYATRSYAELITLGTAAAGGLPAGRLAALAGAVPGLSANDVVTLTGLHATKGNAYLVTLGNGVGGVVPLGQLMALVQAIPALGAADVVALISSPKIVDATQSSNLLGLAKIADATQLLGLLASAKVVDGNQLQTLLGSAKVVDGNQLQTLLASAKVADGNQLQTLLGSAKVADGNQLQTLLASAKVVDGTQLQNLLASAHVVDAAQLLNLLNAVNSGAQLLLLLAGLTGVQLLAMLLLINDADVLTRIVLMGLAGLNPAQITNVITVLGAGGLNDLGIDALLARLSGGLTGQQIHDLVNAMPAAEVVFLNNSAQGVYGGETFAQVVGGLLGAWSIANTRGALATALARGNAVIDRNNLCRLLKLARDRPYALAAVNRSLSTNNLANGHWAAIFTNEARFVADGNQGASALAPDNTGGAQINIGQFNRPAAHGNPPYRVRMFTTLYRLNHFCNGHTFAHFKFTLANCTRAANSTFWPAGTVRNDVRDSATALSGVAAARNAADNAYNGWAVVSAGGFEVGFLQTGTNGPVNNTRYHMRLDQFFPTAGNAVNRVALSAIGKLFIVMPAN